MVPFTITKVEAIRQMTSIARRAGLDYDGLRSAQVMLRLLAHTGMRVAEVVAVEREHVDLEALTVKVVQGKGSKDRGPSPRSETRHGAPIRGSRMS